MPNETERLQMWYRSQCKGDREHSCGATIDTSDNPGWFLTIELQDTALQDLEFPTVSIERSEADWIHSKVQERVFEAAGGPGNLSGILVRFSDWAEQHPGT